MPRNFKEAMLFTCLMCSIMVLGMGVWNLHLVGQLNWSHVAMGFLPAFAVAFLLDVLIVGPVAKKIAFTPLAKLGHREKCWMKTVAISGTMALFMVTFMSVFGLVVNGVPITVSTYLRAWGSNFIMALPLNFLIAGSISRAILGPLQKPLPGEEKVENFEDDEELPTII
ncbi:Uncharacterised protein [Chlamydia trachomatis]|nr:Uncharacterised protein [Chlamydia trachomatis]CRH88906.1 Uncharacterised protein [Chlamydia trachomatis]